MNMHTPLVSVIIPNYNYAQYLHARIGTVLNQTFQDFELILLDDASTDHSADILRSYGNNPHTTHLVINTTNTGSPFAQWFKGIALAQGQYIWIAEADDLAEPNFLQTCVNLMQRHPQAALCHTGSYLIDSAGQRQPRDPNHWGHRSRKPYACLDGQAYASHNLYWKNYIINASAVLFSRQCAMSLNPSHYTGMRYCADWLFWFHMSLRGQVIEVHTCLNHFRQHPHKATTHSRTLGDGIREDAQIVALMEQQLPPMPPYKKRLRRGLLYRKVRRQQLPTHIRQQLFEYLAQTLGATPADYRLERRNQWLRLFLPHLITAKRERL